MEDGWLMIITALLKCNKAVYYEPIHLLLMLILSSQMNKWLSFLCFSGILIMKQSLLKQDHKSKKVWKLKMHANSAFT